MHDTTPLFIYTYEELANMVAFFSELDSNNYRNAKTKALIEKAKHITSTPGGVVQLKMVPK